MRPNANTSIDRASAVVPVNMTEQLAAYDTLPRRWRHLVDSLPIPQVVTTVRRVLDEEGDAEGYERLCQLFEVKFPGWHRPQGVAQSLPPCRDRTERLLRNTK